MTRVGDEHLYIVTYDIADPRRWRAVFKLMHGFGEWLQLSVFQCRLTRGRVAGTVAATRGGHAHAEDHVMIVDVGPAEGCEPRVRSLGKQALRGDRAQAGDRLMVVRAKAASPAPRERSGAATAGASARARSSLTIQALANRLRRFQGTLCRTAGGGSCSARTHSSMTAPRYASSGGVFRGFVPRPH